MNHFLVKHDKNLDTWKNYRHNFQWMIFEWENCIFYVWHKKEIKQIESKNLWSTMTVFYIKDSQLGSFSLDENIKNWIVSACRIFAAFDEENWWNYYFLPYFQTKLIEEKNQIFQKLWINLSLTTSPKWVLIENIESSTTSNIEDLDIIWQIWLLFGLVLLYGKLETKWDKLSSIKIQLPLFGQYLTLWDNLINIQKSLQKQWIFLQISENIQWEKHIYEITSNDYELLSAFADLYLPVENLTQITKREQTQEAIDSLRNFCLNNWENEIIEKINNSCVKILQKN